MQAWNKQRDNDQHGARLRCAASGSHRQIDSANSTDSPGIRACAGEAGAKGRRRILKSGVDGAVAAAAGAVVAVVDLAFADSGIGTWQQAVMARAGGLMAFWNLATQAQGRMFVAQ